MSAEQRSEEKEKTNMAARTQGQHGALFDEFRDQATHAHGGARFDEGFNRNPQDRSSPHGPLYDDFPADTPWCPQCNRTRAPGRVCAICGTPVITLAEARATQARKTRSRGVNVRKLSDLVPHRSALGKDFGAAGDAEPGGQTVTVDPRGEDRPRQRHMACPQCGHEFSADVPADMSREEQGAAARRSEKTNRSDLDVMKQLRSLGVDDGSAGWALRASNLAHYGIVAKEVTVAESSILAEEGRSTLAGAKGGRAYCPECRKRQKLTDDGRCPDCNTALAAHTDGRSRREKGDGNGSAESSTVSKLAPDDDGSALSALKALNAREGIVAKQVTDAPVQKHWPHDDGSPAFAIAQQLRGQYGFR
jgi:ssDNA-binding Zn-finger/Zn-ribbon topoisomerase 1